MFAKFDTIAPMGILNGLFGTRDKDGFGAIAFVEDDETGAIMKFISTEDFKKDFPEEKV